ncbi:MAG: ATP-binding protein [Clostridia bacterium]|nr:ATP-binding protein [Clostridia bacterium]
MYKELREKILNILSDLPSESSWLDYKLSPYDKNHKAEFIKDVCAFLNCTESYGEDKFIIVGIVDKTKYKKGINQNRMEDDKYYQDLCEIIQPRPHVETGEIEIDGLFFGYIYISKDNMERVYSIIKDYPEETVTLDEEKNEIRKKVYASTAYIRKGSVKYLLNEYDRRKIYEQDKEIKNISKENIITYTSTFIDDVKDVLKICALFGTWNEENDEEKQIISKIIGEEYNVWIKTLRKLLSQKSEYISFKNNRWKIEKKEELIERYSENYFAEDIRKFETASLKIIMELDPKFELEADKRMMSNIIGKKTLYSKEMKKSVLETLAYIKSIDGKFINCEKEIKHSQWYIVREVLQDTNWKNLATLNENLPILAEIDEREYIKQLNEMLKNKKDEIEKLFQEKEEYITTMGYTYGLLWSLELIAWNPDYIMEVFDIFGKLGKYDSKVIETMSRILLPWYPQTRADINLRKATLEMVLREYNDIGWNLLMQLMPNKQTHSFPTYKPKWNNIIDDGEIKVTNKELYEQYNEYIKLAIEYSKTNKDRIIKLIDELDDVSKDTFEMICNKITSKEIRDIEDKEKFYIWNELENLIARHKMHSGKDWALPKEAITQLEKVSKDIKPIKEEIYYKRLFNNNNWDLFDDNDSYEEQEKKLLIKQIDALKELLKSGIEKVINFAKTTKDPYRVGIALAEIKLKNSDEQTLLNLLNEDDFLMSQGYVYRKFLNKKFDWLELINFNNISIQGRVRFLIQLPNNKLIWEKVSELLGENEDSYWKEVDVRYVESDSEYDWPLEKLLKCNRPVKALELISMAMHEKREFSNELAAKALSDAVYNQENINYIDVYHIKKIIKELQENNYDFSELFKIEWAYLPILDNNDEYRPITIEKRLSEDPQIFMDIICLAFKAEKEETNKENDNTKLAINAYRLLNIWKLVPGINEDGFVDENKLNDWFNDMKKIAIKKDRLEISLLHLGQVLFYTNKDKDGFWIDRSVAQLLNRDDAETIRRGYSLQAFNSIGVVNVDSEGTAWLNLEKEWNEKAYKTDAKYFRFVKTLKDIAQDFHNQAIYMKEHYDL